MKLDTSDSTGPVRTFLDVVLVLLVVAIVISIAATGPSTTYAYAQLQQIGAVVGSVESGNWLLPRDQFGGLAIKPQLYAWLDGPVLMLTGIYNDFTFRLPTVLASLVLGVLVYFLGRRWYGRRVGLLAACLWATAQHMGKMTYVAVTDMLLSLWILLAIMCADRLLFHRAPRNQRWKWAVGLWAAMIIGAATKGWGIANLILVGGALALATAVGPGFKALRLADDFGTAVVLLFRLVLRRWRKALKATRFGWGILAMVVVLTPIWAGMFIQGGEEFAGVFNRDVFQRITGSGERPPHSRSTGPALNLLYYALPMSVFMVGALLLAGPRKWFTARSSIFLPLCWILAVTVPFSLTHAFRPDYLLPCYAAVALMGAWAIEEVLRRGKSGNQLTQILRHVIAAAPVVIGVGLILLPLIYLFYDYMPSFITKNIKMPSAVPAPTWWVLCSLIGLGVVVLALAVRWSLQWRLRRVAALAVVGMLGVIFIDRHMFSRHARTRDGQKMVAFAREAKPLLGNDEFAVLSTHKLAVELYFGRFGQWAQPHGTPDPKRWTVDSLNNSGIPWLITCDHGLIELGATEIIEQDGKKVEILKPGNLGRVEVCTDPIISQKQKWGKMYLIRLR